MSDCSQPSSVSGWSYGRRGIRRSAGRRAGCAAVRAGRGRGWPAADGRPRGGWCRRGGGSGRARRRATATGRRWGAAATGEDRGGWPGRRAVRSRWLGSRVWPNSESRSGRSVGDSCSARKGFGVPDVRRVGVDAVQQRPPQRRLPVEVGVDVAGDVASPSRRAAAAAGGRRTRRAPRADARRRSAGPAAARVSSPASKWPRWVASVVHQRRRSCRR